MFEFALQLQEQLLVLLEFDPVRLYFDLEVDILLQRALDVVWCEFCEAFFEEVNLQFEREVLFLERVDDLGTVFNNLSVQKTLAIARADLFLFSESHVDRAWFRDADA